MGGLGEVEDEIDELVSKGIVVVEGGEGVKERRDEEVGVEGEEAVEEERFSDGLVELGDCVGDMERRGRADRYEVGEAEEANPPSLRCL